MLIDLKLNFFGILIEFLRDFDYNNNFFLLSIKIMDMGFFMNKEFCIFIIYFFIYFDVMVGYLNIL